ncbi:MAG: hypothetical protein PHP42_13410 [Bacteroidota bacterium]|nr:hypothetical protein [Bacteroidota bacterium]
MMLKKILLPLWLLSCVSLGQAQDTASSYYKNYFGFSGSRVSGVGLTFAMEPEKKITIQITGGIFRTSSNSSSSFGMELQYNLLNENYYRIFIGPAVGTFSSVDNAGTNHEESNSESVFGFAMGGAAPLSGIFDNRLRFSVTLYYPAFYKDNSITVGLGGTLHFLF